MKLDFHLSLMFPSDLRRLPRCDAFRTFLSSLSTLVFEPQRQIHRQNTHDSKKVGHFPEDISFYFYISLSLSLFIQFYEFSIFFFFCWRHLFPAPSLLAFLLLLELRKKSQVKDGEVKQKRTIADPTTFTYFVLLTSVSPDAYFVHEKKIFFFNG